MGTHLVETKVGPNMGTLATNAVVLVGGDAVLAKAAALGAFHIEAVDAGGWDLRRKIDSYVEVLDGGL